MSIKPKLLAVVPPVYAREDQQQFRRAVDQHIREDVEAHLGDGAGTWTPVLVGDTTAGTQTYSDQFGRYVRTSDLVTVGFSMTVSTLDAATAGHLQISGLPFVAFSVFPYMISGGFVAEYEHVTLPSGTTQLGMYADPGTKNIRLVASGSGVGSYVLQVSNVASGLQIRGSFSYFA